MAEVIVNISEPIPKPMPRLPPSGFIKRLYCFSIRTAAIAHIHRIIQAIRICVMPNYTLACGEEDIGRDEPADFGVIVPALEVVETCLLVRQSSDCRYRHIHGNGRDYSFRVWTQVSPRLTAVCPNCQTLTATQSLLR